jgi:CRISPR system Cascade subunit CasD
MEELNTILSSRDYRCDAVYTVAITVSDGAPHTVQVLVAALKKPVFTLYLGRKSCPLSLPLEPQIVSKTTLREALESASFGDDLSSIIVTGTVPIYWEDDSASGLERQQVITRRDALRSRKRWQFVERRENYGTMKKEETPCTSA